MEPQENDKVDLDRQHRAADEGFVGCASVDPETIRAAGQHWVSAATDLLANHADLLLHEVRGSVLSVERLLALNVALAIFAAMGWIGCVSALGLWVAEAPSVVTSAVAIMASSALLGVIACVSAKHYYRCRINVDKSTALLRSSVNALTATRG